MNLEPTRAEEIAAACADLRGRGPFPAAIAHGLEAGDPDKMRAAVTHLIEAGRVEGLRALIERFRNKSDFGVWARMASSQLHRAAGDFAAALADIDDLMARFPARAAAHWWVARARCLEGLERGDEAAATTREGIARFPDVAMPQIFLANLLSRLGTPEQALDVWRDAIARFPEPEFNWFIELSNALLAIGRPEEARVALEDGGRRFPDKFSEPRAAVGRARALFRLDRADEAVDVLETLLAREPDDVPALHERAAIAAELGESERARDLFVQLTQRFPEKSRPGWWAARARAHHDLREFEAGAGALRELEQRFPDSALAEMERLRLCNWLEHGQDELTRRVEQA